MAGPPSWQALGGLATSDPAAAADPEDPAGVYVFTRGGDDALYWQRKAGDAWSGFNGAGGLLTSQPVAVTDRTGVSGTAGVYVFVRGGDGALYVGKVGGGSWEGWQPLGGYLDFFPSATVDATGLWVAVRGGDGGLYARHLRDGVWSPWQAFGGFVNGAPSLVSDSSGVSAFVMGGDSALYVRNLTGGDWQGLGGYLTSAPTATADATGVSVVVRGGDGAAYWRQKAGGVWAPFGDLGGYLSSPPFAGADSTGVSVYVRGGDGGMYRERFDGTSWSGWNALGGYLTSGPASAADGVGFDQVFVVGGDAGLYTMAVASAASGPPLLITTNPSLFPSFDAGVHDYVSRCSASSPVQVSVQAPSGTTVSVDGQPAASGSFSGAVTRDVGKSFTIVTQADAQPAETYYVRCLPENFPTWTVQRSGPTQAEYFVMGGAFATYVAIVDTNGVPMWWNAVPEGAVFAQLLPDGQFGWITTSGNGQELPLAGEPIRPIGTSPIDSHDLLQLPTGHHVVVVDKAVPNVDLSSWGPTFTVGAVLDHVFEELDADGSVVWSWDVMDHIPVSETNVQWRGATGGCNCYDPYHWNSIEPTTEPNNDPGFVVSFRHLDAVFNIDQTTGSIVWRLGGAARRMTSADGTTSSNTSITAADADFSADDIGSTITDSLGLIPAGTTITAVTSPTAATLSHSTTANTATDAFTINAESLTVQGDAVFSGGSHFGGQHDARVLSDGTVTLYDDGTNLGRAPRAVRYQIDVAAKTATLLEEVTDPSLVDSSICCGSARKLPEGNWVIGWGGTNFVTEMTPSGDRVFVLRMTSSPFVYRAIPIPFGQLDRCRITSSHGRETANRRVSCIGSPPRLGNPIIPTARFPIRRDRDVRRRRRLVLRTGRCRAWSRRRRTRGARRVILARRSGLLPSRGWCRRRGSSRAGGR